MALDTYDGLKQSILDHLEDSDLASQVDDFIDLAEAQHKLDIRIRQQLQRDVITGGIAADARFVELTTFDSEFLDMRHLRVLDSDNPATHRYFPDFSYVTSDEMMSISRGTGLKDRPRAWTLQESIQLDRIADKAYDIEVIYYAPFTPLSASNQSNALLSLAPGAYLYGALLAATPFLMHDERIPVWSTFYTTIVEKLNEADLKNRTPAGPVVGRVPNLPRVR